MINKEGFMKNISSVFVLLSLSLALTPFSFAKGKPSGSTQKPASSLISPVQDSYLAGFDYELQTALSRSEISTYKQGSASLTQIEAQVSLSKVIKNNIQAGGEVHLNNLSGGGYSSNYLEAMGFGVYNFDTDLKESLYAKAGIGIQNVVNDKGGNEAKVGIMVGGGKRIRLLEKFTYNPEARIVLVAGETRVNILLLNFSLLF